MAKYVRTIWFLKFILNFKIIFMDYWLQFIIFDGHCLPSQNPYLWTTLPFPLPLLFPIPSIILLFKDFVQWIKSTSGYCTCLSPLNYPNISISESHILFSIYYFRLTLPSESKSLSLNHSPIPVSSPFSYPLYYASF